MSNKPAPEKPETIALLTAIPADLREALEERFELAEPGADLPAGTRIAVTTAMRGLSSEDLARHAGLELVLSQGVGLEKLDLKAASAAGVQVSVTPNILTEDVADFAIGLTYAICRRIAEADRFVRAGRWGPERIRPSTSLRGKRMGIVGMGRIGQAVAHRARAFGLEIAYTNRKRLPEAVERMLGARFVPQLDDLIAEADILTLHCPMTDETRGMIDARRIALMKPGSSIINTARGELIDQEALIAALKSGHLAGAGLDVYPDEPNVDKRLLRIPNVMTLPHIGSATAEGREASGEKVIANIRFWMDGHRPPDQVLIGL